MAGKIVGIIDTIESKKLILYEMIVDEFVESNRLKRLKMIGKYTTILYNPYSEKDDIIVAKLMLKKLEDKI